MPGSEHRPELSYDGNGINGPDEHRTRLATFRTQEDADMYGPLLAAAPEAHEILTELRRWYAGGGAVPFKESMFDENRSWKQALADYFAKAESRS
jgi:hypothetical protein